MTVKHKLVTLFLLLSTAIPAQTISGNFDSRLALAAGAGDAPAFSWGLEELANIRLQARIGQAVFYGAVNLIAAAGSFAQAPGQLAAFAPVAPAGLNLANTSFVSGDQYAAAIELERLYFRLRGENIGLDLGLLRLPLGYSQVWGSTDFLNPKNPLAPNARPRAILGTAFSIFPAGDIKLQIFGSAAKNPYNMTGEGLVFGVTGENHFQHLSAQLIYAYETPQENYNTAGGLLIEAGNSAGIHRFGISIKADVEAGIVGDALFIWNPDSEVSADFLSAAAGLDYSFWGGCYALLEYLFNGLSSSTSQKFNMLTGLANRNYLYALLQYKFNDFTAAGLSCVASFDDISFAPGIVFDHEFAQGINFNLTATVPLDRDLFSHNGKTGELGPRGMKGSGSYINVETLLRLKF
jgi:hypothetical protein